MLPVLVTGATGFMGRVLVARLLEEGRAVRVLERRPSDAFDGLAVERVTGEVSLDASLKGRAQPDDTVFIFARAAEGPRMPLAIVKIRVADLPYKFSFDDSSAMMPQMKV